MLTKFRDQILDQIFPVSKNYSTATEDLKTDILVDHPDINFDQWSSIIFDSALEESGLENKLSKEDILNIKFSIKNILKSEYIDLKELINQ